MRARATRARRLRTYAAVSAGQNRRQSRGKGVVGRIKALLRARLLAEHPAATAAEIEGRVNRIVERGMRPHDPKS